MRFNNNDKKYIIKRVIVFLIVSFISFFIFHGCVHASTVQSTFIDNYVVVNSGSIVSYENLTQSSEYFKSNLTGYLVINLITDSSIPVKEVRIINASNQFACSLGGSFISYGDANTQLTSYGLKCPVQFSTTRGLKTIRVEFIATNRNFNIWVSPLITFVAEESDAQSIINAQQAAAGQTIQAILDQSSTQHADAQSIQNSITSATQQQIQVITNNATQAHNDSVAINNSINSTDSDEESASCGIICKLKYIVSFLKPSNLIHLIVPTQQDWQNCINNAVLSFRNNMGVLGLVMSIFFDCFQVLLGTYIPNYCFTWQDIHVPNFESLTPIIQSGQFCLDQYFQTGILKTFRDTLLLIIGGLIVYAFIQYCLKAVKRILNVQLTGEDEYEYITTTNSYDKMLSDGSMFHTTTRHNYRKRAS